MFSLENLVRIFGDGYFGNILDALDANFGCCAANMHQGWPKFVSHLWMSRDTALAAIAYAPYVIKTVVGAGTNGELTVETDYPFRNRITIKISLDRADSFPISLRFLLLQKDNKQLGDAFLLVTCLASLP